jgi:5-carboxyvanillate decarboxylase
MRVIAVEEHMATEAFLRVAHGLDVVPGDETEMALMRMLKSPPDSRARLVDLDAQLREMDALGQDMAVFSLNPPGVQPYPAADAVSYQLPANSPFPVP